MIFRLNQNLILVFIFCLGIIQPGVYANPFSQTCAQWTSKGAACLYWYFLSVPALDCLLNTLYRNNGLKYINENASNLQDIAPESYTRIQDILHQEGLPGLEGYSIKKTPEFMDKEGVKEWCHFGNKVILIPANVFIPCDEYNNTQTQPSSNSEKLSDKDKRFVLADCEQAAAILSHEMEHAKRYHAPKRALINAIAPFIIHALGRTLVPSQDASGSIRKSLLRIPYGFGAAWLSMGILGTWYSRRTEREADTILKNSPLLALKFAQYLKQEDSREKNIESSIDATWEKVNNGDSSKVGIVDKIQATYLSKSSYHTLMKSYEGLFQTHPSESERIAYLEAWACQAKKQV